MKKFSSLTTFQLRYLLLQLCPNKKHFVCAIDELKDVHVSYQGGIINNQTKREGGLHWLALYIDRKKGYLEVFDSFSLPLQFYGTRIQRFANRNGLKIRRTPFRTQSQSSVMCGYFSVYYLTLRSHGLSFNSIISKFSSKFFRQNETLVKQCFRNIKFPKLPFCKKECRKRCNMSKNDFSSVCVQKNRKCNKISIY